MKLILNQTLKPKKRNGAIKFASFWVEGGYKLKYLTGSMRYGYRYKSETLRLTGIDKLYYYIEKFKQLYLYNYIISFKLSKIIKRFIK